MPQRYASSSTSSISLPKESVFFKILWIVAYLLGSDWDLQPQLVPPPCFKWDSNVAISIDPVEDKIFLTAS